MKEWSVEPRVGKIRLGGVWYRFYTWVDGSFRTQTIEPKERKHGA
jgi:hypothetical protein